MFLLGLGGGCHDKTCKIYTKSQNGISQKFWSISLSTNLDRLCLTMDDLKTK